MRINAGQVSQLVLSTLQGAKDLEGKLELKVGSVVRATLLEQAGKDEVWLQIGGKNLKARLDANLKPGDQVDLLVTGEQKQGAMELKVVGQPIRGGEGGKQLDIAGLVRALGLPETEETRALVQEFAARGIPLKQETIRAALAVLRGVAQVTPSHIATLGKMAELGIQILPSTFEAMHALETGPKLHELLTKIQTTLQNLFPPGSSDLGSEGKVPTSTATVQQGIASEAEASAPKSVSTPTQATTSQAAGANASTQGTAAAQAGVTTPTQGAANTQKGATTPAQGALNTQAEATSTPLPDRAAAVGVAQKQQDAPTTRAGESSGTPIASHTTAASSESVQSASGPTPPASNLLTARVAAALTQQDAVHFPENTPPAPSSTPLGNQQLTASTRTHLEQLLQVVNQLLHSADDAAPAAHHLAEKAKSLGLNFEEQLAHAMRKLPADSDPVQIGNALQQALKSAGEQGSLKHALLLTQAMAKELETIGLGSLQQDVSSLLKNVTGQQLMQTAAGDRADLFFQYAAVPIRFGRQEQTVELHVMSRKGPGQKAIDPANCYVLFHLEMPNLGDLDIHLHIVDKIVGVRFLAENEANLSLTASDQRDLRDALQKVGFHLGVLKVEDKKPPQPGEHQPLLPPILTQRQFDLKI